MKNSMQWYMRDGTNVMKPNAHDGTQVELASQPILALELGPTGQRESLPHADQAEAARIVWY